MPISLLSFSHSLSRRRFLGGVLGAACISPLVSASLSAEEQVSESQRSSDQWAFLADTHIPGDRNDSNGTESKIVEQFRQVRKDILSGTSGRPCGMIVCGDCAQREGLPADYDKLLTEIRPLRRAGMQTHFVVGNHDNRRAFLEAVAREQGTDVLRTIPDRLTSILETPRVNFFLLDSLIRTNYSPGKFGTEQLEQLAADLDARKDKPAVLVAHHYPDYSAPLVSNPHALQDTKAFFECIRDRKQVKAFIFGHAHIWRRFRQHDIHLVNIPSTAMLFGPTEPLGWVLLHIRNDGMTLTLRSIDPSHPKHNETVDLRWRDSNPTILSQESPLFSRRLPTTNPSTAFFERPLGWLRLFLRLQS